MGRGKFSFWLDFKHDDSLIIAEAIDDLKRNRSFSAVIRDGIMIVNELRQGKIDLLVKLYPFVLDAITALIPPPEPPPMPDNADLIEQFRRMLEQQQGRGIPDTRDGGFPAMMPAVKHSSAPPVIAPKAAPVADAGAIADNFLAFIQ
jgi:hypothetical protein